jgi:hypothetical protein
MVAAHYRVSFDNRGLIPLPKIVKKTSRRPVMNEQVPIRTRSWLFTPATRPERFAKAAEIGADVLLIDLEDAVAPRDKAAGCTVA